MINIVSWLHCHCVVCLDYCNGSDWWDFVFEIWGSCYYIVLAGRLAQLVEQLTLNQRVAGSNPSSPILIGDLNGMGELTCLRK